MFTNKDREQKKYRHYIHSPFQLNHQGIVVKCGEHGKIVITQEHEKDDTFSEINCKASLIAKLYRILSISSKENDKDDTTWTGTGMFHSFSMNHNGINIDCKEDGKITLNQDHESDDTFSEINCDSFLIVKVYRMLWMSRKVVWKGEPFKSEDVEEVEE